MTVQVRDPEPVLEGVFSSRVRLKVLTLLFTGEAGRGHAREMAKVTGEHFNAVWQELKHLEALGILQSERVGNRMDYLPNPDMPLFAELRQLLARAAGLEPVVLAMPVATVVPTPPAAPAMATKSTRTMPARRYPMAKADLVMGETD